MIGGVVLDRWVEYPPTGFYMNTPIVCNIFSKLVILSKFDVPLVYFGALCTALLFCFFFTPCFDFPKLFHKAIKSL